MKRKQVKKKWERKLIKKTREEIIKKEKVKVWIEINKKT